MGNTASSNSARAEAETIATQIDDQSMLQLIQDQRLIGEESSRTAARGFGRSSRGPSALQSPRPDGGRCSACDRRGCAPYFDRRSSGVNSNPARGSRHFSRNRRRLRRLRSNTEPHCILEHGGRRTERGRNSSYKASKAKPKASDNSGNERGCATFWPGVIGWTVC